MRVNVTISEPELTSSVVHKMTMSQDRAQDLDVYYNCVNSSATQSFKVTPEAVYDRLFSSNSTNVCISLL